MQSLFLGQLDERLAKSEGDRSNACFPSLLAVQHQVTDEAALALSKAKAGTGLARALLSGAWSPSPEVFLECLRAHRNHDPAACLAGAMLKRNPRFPLDHPEVAHAVMEELVRLCINAPTAFELRRVTYGVLAAVIGSGHRCPLEDKKALVDFASLGLLEAELRFLTAMGRVGYPLPDGSRQKFFAKVLEPFVDLEADTRLNAEPWRGWVQDGRGIDPVQLAQHPGLAEAWGAMIAQNKAEVLGEAWSDDRVSASCERARL